MSIVLLESLSATDKDFIVHCPLLMNVFLSSKVVVQVLKIQPVAHTRNLQLHQKLLQGDSRQFQSASYIMNEGLAMKKLAVKSLPPLMSSSKIGAGLNFSLMFGASSIEQRGFMQRFLTANQT